MACGECADRARMQQPYEPSGSPVSNRSVTAKRPVGVGASDAPTATVKRATTRPPSSTVSRRAPSETSSFHGTRLRLDDDWAIHATRLLPAWELITPSHPG